MNAPFNGYGFAFVGNHIACSFLEDIASKLDALTPLGGHWVRVLIDHCRRLEVDQRAEYRRARKLVTKMGKKTRRSLRAKPRLKSPRSLP